MDKKIAQEIVSLLISIDDPAGKVLDLLNTLENEEAKPLRKAVRKIVIDIYADILRPIFKQYPELDSETYYGSGSKDNNTD